jgi:hypothetical protein
LGAKKAWQKIARLFHAGTQITRVREIERKDPSNFRNNPPARRLRQASLARYYFGSELDGPLAAALGPARSPGWIELRVQLLESSIYLLSAAG